MCRNLLPMKNSSHFWQQFQNKFGCWIWVGCSDKKGYGSVCRASYGEGLAHRLSWVFHKGEIPNGLHVCHRCNNPSCVNPEHLYLATNSENIKDAWRDGLCRNQNSAKKCCSKCGGGFKRFKLGRYCPECKKESNRRTAKLRRERMKGQQ